MYTICLCVMLLCSAIAGKPSVDGLGKSLPRDFRVIPLDPPAMQELNAAVQAFRSLDRRTSNEECLALARLLNRAAVTEFQEEQRAAVADRLCSLAEDILDNKTHVRFSPGVSDGLPDPKTGLPVYDPCLAVLRNTMYAITKQFPWHEHVKRVVLRFLALTNTPQSSSYSLSIRSEILHNYLASAEARGYPAVLWQDAGFLRDRMDSLPPGQFTREKKVWIEWDIFTQVSNSGSFKQIIDDISHEVRTQALVIADKTVGNYRMVVWSRALADKYPPDKAKVASLASACRGSRDPALGAAWYYLLLGYLNCWIQGDKRHERLPEYYAVVSSLGRQILAKDGVALKKHVYIKEWYEIYCRWTVRGLAEQGRWETLENIARGASEPQWLRDIAKAAMVDRPQSQEFRGQDAELN